MRSPWPTFAVGLGLSLLGLAAYFAWPGARTGGAGVLLAVVTFGGLLILSISPALQGAENAREGLRRWKAGLRWIVSWFALFQAFTQATRAVPLPGEAGTPLRLISAVAVVGFSVWLSFFLAGYVAEGLRRAAAWLGEENPR